MNNNCKHLYLFWYFTLLTYLPLSFAQNEICTHPDYTALVEINKSLSGFNWDESDCDVCNWNGIACNNQGRVVSLRSSTVGASFVLSGEIPAQIGDLPELDTLILESSMLEGTLPNEIGNLIHLRILIISGSNTFSGNIPMEIGNLSKLEILALRNTNLTGTIPPELYNLTNLRRVLLRGNSLTGNVSSKIGKLTNLVILDLGNNELSGVIPPEIGNLRNVVDLNLTANNITGSIPKEISTTGADVCCLGQGAGVINLRSNQLSGCYPRELEVFCQSSRWVNIRFDNNPELPFGGDFTQFLTACSSGSFEDFCPINNTASCETLQFMGATAQIAVSGLTTSSKVEIIGRNTGYQTILICEDDCSEVQTIEDLEAGEYTVKVNLFDGENYCYREASVMVEGDNTNNVNGPANCENLIFIGEEGQITIDGLTASNNRIEILGHNTDWQVITICDGDCSPIQVIPDLAAGEYVVKINQYGNDGSYCYSEEKVLVTDGGNTGSGSVNCENLIFSSNNDTIIVSGLTADYNKVEILGRNTNWQVLTICDGDCSSTQNISDLANGEYSVKVNQGGNDGSYCYREEQILVENGSDSRNSAIDFGSDLVLYPNPARDRIHLQFTSLSEKEGNIQIYNAFGQVVQSIVTTRFEGDLMAIDLDEYENGVYLMTIKVGQLPLVSRRFVVEHLR